MPARPEGISPHRQPAAALSDSTPRAEGRPTAEEHPINRRRIPVILVAAAAVGLSACSGGLSASSTCRDSLQASPQEQNRAVSSIAADVGAQNAVTPLGRPNVDYLCAGSPSMTLGDAVRKTGAAGNGGPTGSAGAGAARALRTVVAS